MEMGLDMYLTAEKFLSRYDEKSQNTIKAINDLFGMKDPGEDYTVENIVFSIAYWRKANHIHRWFVENVQDGKDECQKSYVTRDQIASLVEICKTVLSNHNKATELLPTTGGFFFGSTEYDEGYFEDLKSTVFQLERVLNSPVFEDMDLYYKSSW